MDEVVGANVPIWHERVSQYAGELAEQIEAECVVEAYNAGKSFEARLARVRYTKDGLHVIIEFSDTSELFVADDSDAVDFAFTKADPFDGATATIAIEKVRQAYLLKGN
jgi:hypothetical protein